MLASTAFFLGLFLGGFILVVVLIYDKSGKTNKQVTKINFKFLNQL